MFILLRHMNYTHIYIYIINHIYMHINHQIMLRLKNPIHITLWFVWAAFNNCRSWFTLYSVQFVTSSIFYICKIGTCDQNSTTHADLLLRYICHLVLSTFFPLEASRQYQMTTQNNIHLWSRTPKGKLYHAMDEYHLDWFHLVMVSIYWVIIILTTVISIMKFCVHQLSWLSIVGLIGKCIIETYVMGMVIGQLPDMGPPQVDEWMTSKQWNSSRPQGFMACLTSVVTRTGSPTKGHPVGTNQHHIDPCFLDKQTSSQYK